MGTKEREDGSKSAESEKQLQESKKEPVVPAIRGMESPRSRQSRASQRKSSLTQPLLTKSQLEAQEVKDEMEQARLEKLARTNRLRSLKARADARLQAVKGLRTIVEATEEELARYRVALSPH